MTCVVVDGDGCVVLDGDGCVVTVEVSDGYVQARRCSDDTLADVWMTTADAASFPNAFTLLNGSFGYYFSGDTGTPGTIYTASEATAYANCAAIPTCGSGSCGASPTNDTVDLSGVWDLVAYLTPVAYGPMAEPCTLTYNGGCVWTNHSLSGGVTSLPGAGTDKFNINGDELFIRSTFDPFGNPLPCDTFFYRVSFQDTMGHNLDIYYRGVVPNGLGSEKTRLYWCGDSTSTTFDENGIATDGVSLGNVRAYVDIV